MPVAQIDEAILHEIRDLFERIRPHVLATELWLECCNDWVADRRVISGVCIEASAEINAAYDRGEEPAGRAAAAVSRAAAHTLICAAGRTVVSADPSPWLAAARRRVEALEAALAKSTA